MKKINTFEELKNYSKNGITIIGTMTCEERKLESTKFSGKITISDGQIFICNNILDTGDNGVELQGYKYSWWTTETNLNTIFSDLSIDLSTEELYDIKLEIETENFIKNAGLSKETSGLGYDMAKLLKSAFREGYIMGTKNSLFY